MSKDYPWGKGTPTWVRDATLNDSDKSFTVPAGKIWKLISVVGELQATATVGNRNLLVAVTNGTNNVWMSTATGNIAASTFGVINCEVGGALGTSLRRLLSLSAGGLPNVGQQNALPDALLLPAGYVVHVWDVSAVDAAADDMHVVLHYVEYDA